MKQKGSIGAVLLILLLIIIIGLGAAWYFAFQPHRELERARTPDTSVNTNSDSLFKKTEVKQKGLNVLMVITPSENDVLSGKVTIKATEVPEETMHVGFSINEKFEDLGQGGPNLGFDSDGSDGWEIPLDTTEYENGEYYVAVFVFDNDASSNPLGAGNVKVAIKN
jgi:hypothetical protein